MWAQQADDGGFFIYGETDTFGAGEIDIWVLKTDGYGAIGPDCPAGIVFHGQVDDHRLFALALYRIYADDGFQL